MINPKKEFNIYEYAEIFIRRKWYAFIPFAVIILITAGVLLLSPRKYQSSTLILVTPQKVPEDFVKPTVTARIEDRLQTIAQESLSRTRLEQIISEMKLYESEKKWLKQEEIVELMRKNIKVEIKGKEGFFSISYSGEDPKTVTTVANRLASMFIEENLKFREQQAQGTTEFLAGELKSKKKILEDLEMAMTRFKRQYMGELPEQREANLKILEQLQFSFQRISENMRSAQDRKLIMQKQLAELDFPQTAAVETSSTQLEELKNALVALRSKYTELHPDIVTTKKKMKELEMKEDDTSIKKSPRYRELTAQLTALDLEITRLKEEEGKIKSQINRYRERIENIPIREQEMAALSREYANTKTGYETLLKKSQEAQQAENLEFRQKGEQFKIIDPARIPEKPVQPNIPRVLLIGLLLAIGGGIAAVVIRENLDHSFRDSEDVEISLGFKVLANIPRHERKAA